MVVVVGRKSSEALEALPVEVVCGVDVSDTAAVDKMAKDLAAGGKGPIDILINNAGYFYGPNETIKGATLNFDEEIKQIDICAVSFDNFL